MWGSLPIIYQLADDFTTARATGTLNSTASEPGGTPTRNIKDTSTLLSLLGSQALIGLGGAANDPNITWNQSWVRAAGRTFAMKCNSGNLATHLVGWSGASTGLTTLHKANWNNGALRWGTGFGTIATMLHNAPYWFFIVLRSTGAFLFVLGAEFAYPTLVYVDRLVSTTPVYPAYGLAGVVNGGNLAATNARIPDDLLYPTALCSDSFNRANGVLGNSDSFDTGTIKTWSDQLGTSAIASNVAGFSALSGSIGIATIDSGKASTVTIAKLTRSAGNVGIITRYVDSNNYVRIYHDGTNVKISKRIAGVDTEVGTAVIAYSAGADLQVIWERTNVRVFYNNTGLSSSAISITDTAIQNSTLVGLYTTDTGNTFDDFSTWARGISNEYLQYRTYGVIRQTKPIVIWDGDSLTRGTGTDVQSYPYQTIDLLGRSGYDSYNTSVTGQICADLLADMTFSFAPLTGISNKLITCLEIGSNDLVNTRSAAAIYADITTLLNNYHSGGPIALGTVTPRLAIGGAQETQRLALNALIVANSIGADGIMNFAADSRLQNINDTTYFNGDKTHMTTVGNGVKAAIAQPILAGL